jgi:hypothetical protein
MKRKAFFSLALGLFILPSVVSSQTSTLRGYREAAAVVQRKSRVPLRLPSEIPDTSELYAILESADIDGYEIQLALTENCAGGNACHAGYLSGSSKPLPKEDRQQHPVVLVHGIEGQFIEFTCGAHCDDSAIYWTEDGYHYAIGLKAGKESALIKLANSAINSGVLK